MKLSEIKNGNLSAEWAEKGYELPKFDIEAVKAKTHAEPTWVHFGAGNIFRAFPAAILNDALNTGKYDRGVIVAESFDYEIIDKAYRPYDNMSLLVCLKSTGEIEKKVVASVTESLKADYSFGEDWARLVEIFQNPSLQMISFTITEKGYALYRPDGSCLPPKQAAEKMLAGIEAIAAQCNHLIIVSNEVFSGGADYAGETDLYLQALAMVNNAVAAKADAVCRVVCGLPVYYKGGERP